MYEILLQIDNPKLPLQRMWYSMYITINYRSAELQVQFWFRERQFVTMRLFPLSCVLPLDMKTNVGYLIDS